MPEINSGSSIDGVVTRAEASWLLVATFAGLGTGFIMLILTLSMIYSVVLSSVGVVIIWFLARNEKGKGFALQAAGIYFVSAVIGTVVGWGSTVGTGLPVVSLIQKLWILIFY
jgi:hypothetical protein